jgi:hypothetical protein
MPTGPRRPWRHATDTADGGTSVPDAERQSDAPGMLDRSASFSTKAASARLTAISVRGAAIVVVVVAFASVALRAVETARSGRELIGASTPSRLERELGSSPLGDIDTRSLLLRSREAIPANATYTVVVGDTTPVPRYIHDGVPPLLQYWLLPRRYTDDIHAADWIVAVHASSELLGVPVRREIGLGADANALEVAR